MDIHNIMISIKAMPMVWKWKKSKLHQKLRNSCNPNAIIAVRLSALAGRFKTIKREMPMIMYRMVHTGPNTVLGGLKDGCLRVAYQVFTLLAVKYAETPPTTKGKAIQLKSMTTLRMVNCICELGLPAAEPDLRYNNLQAELLRGKD